MSKISGELILAIDTSFEGGSLSVLCDRREIDFWKGRGEISKAEDILQAIDQLLKKNNIKKKDLNKLVVSTGPGSFTSIRIGMATALGLAKYLDCLYSGVSILDAINFAVRADTENKYAIDVYFYKQNKTYWQYASDNVGINNSFLLDAAKKIIPPETHKTKIYADNFEGFLQNLPDDIKTLNILAQTENQVTLKNAVSEFQKNRVGELNINWLKVLNLAKYIGEAGSASGRQTNFEPLYI